jgi:hypothetical protein
MRCSHPNEKYSTTVLPHEQNAFHYLVVRRPFIGAGLAGEGPLALAAVVIGPSQHLAVGPAYANSAPEPEVSPGARNDDRDRVPPSLSAGRYFNTLTLRAPCAHASTPSVGGGKSQSCHAVARGMASDRSTSQLRNGTALGSSQPSAPRACPKSLTLGEPRSPPHAHT